MKNLIVTFAFALMNQLSFAHLETNIFQDIEPIIANKIDIRPLPDKPVLIVPPIPVIPCH